MKVVVQRVNKASVVVSKKEVGKIDKGLLVFVGFTHNDNIDNIKYIVNKIINLRIFDDESGVMNLSIKDKNYEILSVSQFTLYADTKKGNRPSYINSLNYVEAEKLYNLFNDELRKTGLKVETGIFRSDMNVSLENDGPVTIIMER
ncbi:MAG: D-aminoacyl-tRNA deacylase [bacterium]|nr:D-aminoacyl-tRNA deacylase [bacterium]